MVKFLSGEGFALDHISGSHHVMKRHPLSIPVPVHGNRPLARGTLHAILADARMPRDEFIRKFTA